MRDFLTLVIPHSRQSSKSLWWVRDQVLSQEKCWWGICGPARLSTHPLVVPKSLPRLSCVGECRPKANEEQKTHHRDKISCSNVILLLLDFPLFLEYKVILTFITCSIQSARVKALWESSSEWIFCGRTHQPATKLVAKSVVLIGFNLRHGGGGIISV
jgi:hypothetical protein